MRPYYLQPFRILPYLGKERLVWPKEVTTELYLSAEDALWDLLPRLGIRRGATILLPNIYCKDVVENIMAHGYKVSFYPVNADGTFVLKDILEVIKAIQPDVFVDFQYAGIKSTLLSEIERKLDFRTLVISDRVHELVYPHIRYFPHSDRHVIICSYRKVTPFPGSLVIYTRNARISHNKLPLRYTAIALVQWIRTLVLAKFAYIFSSSYFGKLSEESLQSHNDHIGDAKVSAALPVWLKSLYEYIAVERIVKTKREQAEIYKTLLVERLSNKNKVLLESIDDFGTLQGFPIIVASDVWDKFLTSARKVGLLRYYQIEYMVTQSTERIALLPLGPSLTMKDIEEICRRIRLICEEKCGEYEKCD